MGPRPFYKNDVMKMVEPRPLVLNHEKNRETTAMKSMLSVQREIAMLSSK